MFSSTYLLSSLWAKLGFHLNVLYGSLSVYNPIAIMASIICINFFDVGIKNKILSSSPSSSGYEQQYLKGVIVKYLDDVRLRCQLVGKCRSFFAFDQLAEKKSLEIEIDYYFHKQVLTSRHFFGRAAIEVTLNHPMLTFEGPVKIGSTSLIRKHACNFNLRALVKHFETRFDMVVNNPRLAQTIVGSTFPKLARAA